MVGMTNRYVIVYVPVDNDDERSDDGTDSDGSGSV